MSTQRKVPDWVTELPCAHRGLHTQGAEVPENTLLAFRKACEAGYAIEMDVYQLADGGIVVFHDGTLTRLAGVDGKVIEQTTPYLTSLPVHGSGETIPTFEAALAEINGRSPIYVEIKASARPAGDFEAALIKILSQYEGEFMVESFASQPMAYFREYAPQMLRGQISCSYSWIKDPAAKPDLLKQMEESQPDYLAYDHREIDSEIQRIARERGIPIMAWTVTTEEQAEAALKKADNIVFELIRPEIPTRHG